MDLFLSIPEELSKQLIVEWLKVVNVAKLDSAYMSHNSRARFLSLIAIPQSIIKHVVGPSFKSADDNIAYVIWLVRRRCHIHSVCVPAEIAIDGELLRGLFQSCGPSLNQIELLQYGHKSEQSYALIVAQIAEHCHYLQALTLTEGFPEDPNLLHQLSLRCPYINQLTFNMCVGYCGDQNKDMSFFALRTFAATDTPLSDNFLAEMAAGSANLQEFSLADVSGVSTIGLETVAANCPLLQTVRLIYMYVEDADVLPFATRCKHLHTLKVVGTSDTFTDAFLTAIAENCPLLHTLRLAECGAIKDSGVEKVLKSCTELRHLSLEGITFLTDETLYSIAENCPLLTTLSIEGGTYFSEEGLQAVAEGCTALRCVTFSTEGGLTEESADLFGEQVEVVCEESFNDYIRREGFKGYMGGGGFKGYIGEEYSSEYTGSEVRDILDDADMYYDSNSGSD